MENLDPAVIKNVLPNPGVFSAYGTGWKQFIKYFLELLLVISISIIVTIPSLGLYVSEFEPFLSNFISLDFIFFEIRGTAAYMLFAVAYIIFVEWPIDYGVSYTALRASRNQNVKVGNIFEVYKNFSNTVFANILTTLIIGAGFIFFIIPGIYFACKLSFVDYLIVDRKMEVVEAIKESWRLTNGYTFKIFLLGLAAFFVGILGLAFFGIGILFSIIWIRVSFAAFYHHVVTLKNSSEVT